MWTCKQRYFSQERHCCLSEIILKAAILLLVFVACSAFQPFQLFTRGAAVVRGSVD